MMSEAISYGARCTQIASKRSYDTALIIVHQNDDETEISWKELDSYSNQVARYLLEAGVDESWLVTIALNTGEEHFFSALGAWKIGACVLPLNDQLPKHERDALIEVSSEWKKVVIIGEWKNKLAITLPKPTREVLGEFDSGFMQAKTPQPGRAIGSGGSTGRPKIIIDPKPFNHVPGCWGPLTRMGLKEKTQLLITGRLYHSMGFELSHVGLFEGAVVIMPEKFTAERTIDLIEKHKIEFMAFIPIMMQRIAKLPGIEKRDFSSLVGFYHAGGACAKWLKEKWLGLVPAEKHWELYGSTEAKGQSMIRGDEWLKKKGSVGKPYNSAMKIVDEDYNELAAGEIGEIHMKNLPPKGTVPGAIWPEEPTCQYVGAPPPSTTTDGFTSVGDMGYADEDGFIFLVDRRVDMIKSGGSNIFTAEVEAVLSEHEKVSDAVVIGVPDNEWGLRVHALIEPKANLSLEEIDEWCRDKLVYYKAPKSYEFVKKMPRDETGKIKKLKLREDRKSGWIDGMMAVKKPVQQVIQKLPKLS